jgi:hypothetical protein
MIMSFGAAPGNSTVRAIRGGISCKCNIVKNVIMPSVLVCRRANSAWTGGIKAVGRPCWVDSVTIPACGWFDYKYNVKYRLPCKAGEEPSTWLKVCCSIPSSEVYKYLQYFGPRYQFHECATNKSKPMITTDALK